MIGLVREAGGLGDVICTGAAARAIDDEVVSFVPEEFVDVARHLEGVSKVVSLGSLQTIQRNRRSRDAVLDPEKYPYLKVLEDYEGARFVDLWCPPFAYESSHPEPLEYNRCQLFAMAAGVRNLRDVRPVWQVEEQEQLQVKEWRSENELSSDPAQVLLIGVQLRGTCAARSIPMERREELVRVLSELGRVVLFDCVSFPFSVPHDTIQCVRLPTGLVAGIVEQCAVVVTVDSFLWHLSAALSVPAVGIFGPTDGATAAQTYPKHVALDGVGQVCAIPCNYNSGKRWTKVCRKTGCERMLSHTIESICEATNSALRSLDHEL